MAPLLFASLDDRQLAGVPGKGDGELAAGVRAAEHHVRDGDEPEAAVRFGRAVEGQILTGLKRLAVDPKLLPGADIGQRDQRETVAGRGVEHEFTLLVHEEEVVALVSVGITSSSCGIS